MNLCFRNKVLFPAHLSDCLHKISVLHLGANDKETPVYLAVKTFPDSQCDAYQK